MIRLNEHELSWFNHHQHLLSIPEGTSAAAEIFTKYGVHGIPKFHKAIVARSVEKIQRLLDETS